MSRGERIFREEEHREGMVEEYCAGGDARRRTYQSFMYAIYAETSTYLGYLVVNFDHMKLIDFSERLDEQILPIGQMRNDGSKAVLPSQIFHRKCGYRIRHDNFLRRRRRQSKRDVSN